MDKYIQKKLKNQELIKFIGKHIISDTNKERIRNCGGFLTFMANHDYSQKKLYHANFCSNRFCPTCSWRKAKKDAMKIATCMKYIEEQHNRSFIFLTLTAPNVTNENLKEEINRFNKAFKKMFERKRIQQMNKGYIRKLEITYNEKENTYHPHFHVLIAVNKSYFKNKEYIKRDEWLEHWQDVMNDKNITQVDVRKVQRDSEGKDVNEIAKYAAKDSEMLKNSDVFDTFYKTLKGRQIATYNKVFKESVKLYKDKQLEEYKEKDDTDYIYFLMYNWSKNQYIETERRELNEVEKLEIMNQQAL